MSALSPFVSTEQLQARQNLETHLKCCEQTKKDGHHFVIILSKKGYVWKSYRYKNMIYLTSCCSNKLINEEAKAFLEKKLKEIKPNEKKYLMPVVSAVSKVHFIESKSLDTSLLQSSLIGKNPYLSSLADSFETVSLLNKPEKEKKASLHSIRQDWTFSAHISKQLPSHSPIH
jgi:hypothetical protein